MVETFQDGKPADARLQPLQGLLAAVLRNSGTKLALAPGLLEQLSVGKHDDWFQIGGHALRPLRLPSSAIWGFPSLRGLAAAIRKTPVKFEP